MGGSADSVERGARQDDPPLCLRLCSRPSSDSDGLPTCASPRKTGRAEASSEHNRRLSEAGKAPDSQGLRWPWRGRAFKILLRFARSGSLLLRDRLGVQTGTANLRTLFNAYPKTRFKENPATAERSITDRTTGAYQRTYERSNSSLLTVFRAGSLSEDA